MDTPSPGMHNPSYSRFMRSRRNALVSCCPGHRGKKGCNMIGMGCYDAFAKWEICRYWENKDAVADLGVDKFNRPRLPRWHAAARSAGSAACFDYIRAKVRFLGAGSPAAEPSSNGDEINLQISRLSKQLGR